MNVFLDTSSLFKLYHTEIDSLEVEAIFEKNVIEGLRTLGSLQLATSVYLKNTVEKFYSSDKLLVEFLKKEKLNNNI